MATIIKKTTKYMLCIPMPKIVQLGKDTIQPYQMREITGATLQDLLTVGDVKLDGAIVIEAQNIHYMKAKTIPVLELEDAPNAFAK